MFSMQARIGLSSMWKGTSLDKGPKYKSYSFLLLRNFLA